MQQVFSAPAIGAAVRTARSIGLQSSSAPSADTQHETRRRVWDAGKVSVLQRTGSSLWPNSASRTRASAETSSSPVSVNVGSSDRSLNQRSRACVRAEHTSFEQCVRMALEASIGLCLDLIRRNCTRSNLFFKVRDQHVVRALAMSDHNNLKGGCSPLNECERRCRDKLESHLILSMRVEHPEMRLK